LKGQIPAIFRECPPNYVIGFRISAKGLPTTWQRLLETAIEDSGNHIVSQLDLRLKILNQ
jgi:hypothetical protein